jgi:hypothetical protein
MDFADHLLGIDSLDLINDAVDLNDCHLPGHDHD